MTESPTDLHRRRFLRDSARYALMLGATSLPLLPAFAGVPGPRHDAAPLARVRGGRLRGQLEQGVNVFRGIPYGADTASRRFQPAVQEAAWRGVRDALAYGNAAPQGGSEGPGSEDCLFLNVWTPALRDGGKRPILFYIHGGA